MMRPQLMICAYTLILLVIVKSWVCPAAQAAEGASSNYTPGTYGNLAVAMQPQPGSFAVINYLGYVSSNIDRAVLNNKAATNVDSKQVFAAPLGLYPFKTPILGGALFSAGGWVAFPWVSLDTTLTTAAGSVQSSQTNFGIGQSGLIPAYLSWKLGGNFSLAAYEAIYIPTGPFHTGDPLNLNRGYWLRHECRGDLVERKVRDGTLCGGWLDGQYRKSTYRLPHRHRIPPRIRLQPIRDQFPVRRFAWLLL